MVLQEKHKLATRWFHWVNFPILSIMIVSGMLIYWAYDPYQDRNSDASRFSIFSPTGFTTPRISITSSRSAWRWHFLFAWIFALNGIAYVIYTAVSGEWRELLPERKSFREALLVVKHDMGLNVGTAAAGPL